MTRRSEIKVVVTGPDKGGFFAWMCTKLAIRLAGGTAIRMTPSRFNDGVNNLSYDAYVIGGGSDVHPSNRRSEAISKPTTKRKLSTQVKESILYPMEFISRFSKTKYDPPRDEMEKQFITYALSHSKPLLGICRGHQLLNSILGGTMFTSTLDVLRDRKRIRSIFPRKDVIYTKEDSLIHEIAGDDPLPVNAIHSQAVAKTGHSLQQTAVEKSGITQVIETTDDRPVLGVQWHPEYLPYLRAHRAIFTWLINEAKAESQHKATSKDNSENKQ